MRSQYVLLVVVLLALGFGVGRLSAASGTLDSPGPPESTFSYTLDDIYHRLADGTEAAQSAFTEPDSGPGTGTFHTLNEIYDLIGQRAPVPKTGQNKCFNASGTEISCANTGQDGDHQKGVAWRNPRFTDNGDGTVTDNLTGLIWLKNANCFGNRTWAQALAAANNLGAGICGLLDGSSAGDWRLPNVRELQSLVHYGRHSPAVPNTAGTGRWSEEDPFTGVKSQSYWSSTTGAVNEGNAWTVRMGSGYVFPYNKGTARHVWPVRSGE